MEQEELNAPKPEEKGILIKGINYSYSILKSENDKESLIIKLNDPSQRSNIYFTYEAPTSKLIKDIKFLSLCDGLDEMIDSLYDVFNQGNAFVEEKDGEYSLEFKVSGIKKKCIIQLIKHQIEQPKEGKNELEDKIDKLEDKYKDLLNKFEGLKTVKESIVNKNEIKNIIKEVIFDKDIELKLFEEMEKMLLSKYNLNNILQNKDENMENNIINKVQEVFKNKEEKINNQIISLKNQLKENIDYLNNIKSNNYNNYITLQVKIEEKDLKKDVKLFNQVSTYKYFCNFERDDIEVIIDDQIVPIKFKNSNKLSECEKCEENFNNCRLSQKIEYDLNIKYEYYWNFTTIGMHSVKIIFKKRLLQCNKLFYYCPNIYKIDCSNFDCSQIIDCSEMFSSKISNDKFGIRFIESNSLTEINLGKLDFSLSNNFSKMFRGCLRLEKLDVSYLNTQNSESFEEMFFGCMKLKEINVSKFKTTNCKDIQQMFFYCRILESIDMLNWDMRNVINIESLFEGCSELKIIKMNFNNNNQSIKGLRSVFKGLPKGGSFIWKKGVDCDELLKNLPVSWNRSQE